MAFNTKGITIEINGNASGFEQELRKVKSEVQGVDHQLQKLSRSMRSQFNSSSTGLDLFLSKQGMMQSKYANLAKQIDTYNQALRATKQCYEENVREFGEFDSRTISAAQNVEYLESELAMLHSQMDSIGASMLTCSSSGMVFYNTLGNISEKADQVYNKLKPISMISAGLMAGAVASAISFEDAWAGVTKTVDGTPQQLQSINDGLKDLALNTASSYESLAGFAELGGQMGVATDSIVTFTETIAMLGDTTNIAGEEAAQALAQIANIMVDSGSRTADYYERFGSTVVDLGNNFATTESDIVEMTQRLATAGRQVGMSTPQVMALATALGSMGIKAAEGGGSMSKLIKQIETAVSTGSESLQEYANVANMSAQEFAQAWEQDAGQAFARFLEGIGKSENVTKTLEDLGIKEIRMSNATGALAQSTDLYTDALARADSAWEQNTAMVEEAEKRYATLKTTLSQAWEAIKQAGDALGQSLTPIIKDAANGIKDLANWFSDLPNPIQDTIAKMLVLGAVSAPAAKGVSLLAKGGQKTIQTFFGMSDGATTLAKMLGKSAKATENTSKFMNGYAKKTLQAAEASGGATTSIAGLTEAFGISIPVIAGVVGTLTLLAGAFAIGMAAGNELRDTLDEQARAMGGAAQVNAELIDSSRQYREEAQQNVEASKRIISENRANEEQTDRLASKIQYLNGIENLNTTQKEMLKTAVDQLKQLYPELNISIDENTGHIQQNTDELAKNLEQAKKSAREQALLKASQEQLEAITKQKLAYDDAKASLSYWNKEVRDSALEMSELSKSYGEGVEKTEEYQKAFHNNAIAMEEQRRAQAELKACIDEGKISWEDYYSTINQMGGEASTLNSTLIEEFKSMVTEASQAGIQIPENLRQGIESGSAEPVAAINFMSALMTYNDMIATAGEGGMAIPVAVANGMMANAASEQEAANYLNNLINFENKIAEMNLTGQQISSELAMGVMSGVVPVEEATNAIRQGMDAQLKLLDTYGIGVEKGTDVSKGIDTGTATAPNSMAKVGNSLKSSMDGWGLDAKAQQIAKTASASFDKSLNPAIPDAAKKANSGAESAFSGSGLSGVVSGLVNAAANAFQSGISRIPGIARSAYQDTKTWVDKIQALSERNFSVNVTKNIKEVVTRTEKPEKAAPRRMAAFAMPASLDANVVAYASRAQSPVATAVEGAMGYASQSMGNTLDTRFSLLEKKMDALIKTMNTGRMESYLRTIASNSTKGVYIGEREVGKILAQPVEEANANLAKFKRKIGGNR